MPEYTPQTPPGKGLTFPWEHQVQAELCLDHLSDCKSPQHPKPWVSRTQVLQATLFLLCVSRDFLISLCVILMTQSG